MIYKYESPKKTAETKKSKETLELESMIKDPNILRSLNTIADTCIHKGYSKEIVQYQSMDCTTLYHQLLQQDPSLLIYLSGKLQLPISEKKFSALSGIQKMSFIALEKTFTALQSKKEGYNRKLFETRLQKELMKITTTINTKFELSHLKNLNRLSTTLKEFGVSEKDIPKVERYLLLVDKIEESKIQKAGSAVGYLIVAGLGIIVGALGYYALDHLFSSTPVDIHATGRSKIEDPKGVLELITAKAGFEITEYNKRIQFGISEDDGIVTERAKKAANLAQNSEMTVQLQGELAMKFDLEHMNPEHFGMEYDGDTGTLYIHLDHPQMVITESKFKVLHHNRELIQNKSFKNQTSDVVENLQQRVVKDALQNKELYDRFIQESEEKIGKTLLGWSYGQGAKPLQKVVISVHLPPEGTTPPKTIFTPLEQSIPSISPLIKE